MWKVVAGLIALALLALGLATQDGAKVDAPDDTAGHAVSVPASIPATAAAPAGIPAVATPPAPETAASETGDARARKSSTTGTIVNGTRAAIRAIPK